MDKTEFIRRYGELKQQINLLKKEYIESNITFPVGTKVKVTTSEGKSRVGIVTDTIVDVYDVVPYIEQLSKDGEQTGRRIIVYPGYTVERI